MRLVLLKSAGARGIHRYLRYIQREDVGRHDERGQVYDRIHDTPIAKLLNGDRPGRATRSRSSDRRGG
jgi:hypothetical protein